MAATLIVSNTDPVTLAEVAAFLKTPVPEPLGTPEPVTAPVAPVVPVVPPATAKRPREAPAGKPFTKKRRIPETQMCTLHISPKLIYKRNKQTGELDNLGRTVSLETVADS